MAKFSLSRYDTQARVSLGLALFSVVCLLGLAVLIFQHLDLSQWVITYGRFRRLVIMGATAGTILVAAIAFGMGLNSAGQRRNDKPLFSWLGFFISAGVICMSLILFFLFRTRGEMYNM